MRLLYLNDAPVDSGRANVIQVLHMCYTFAKVGVEVTLTVPANGGDLRYIRELVKSNIAKDANFDIRPYRKISFCGKLNMIGGYPGIRQIVRQEDADYCFVRNPMFVNATIEQNIPTIFESHDATIHDNYLWNFLWTRNLVKNCNRAKLVKFISISQRLAEKWIARGVPPQKVMVLHDGVAADAFRVVPDGKKLREQLGLPTDKKIVIYAGSLYVDREIENILHLARSFPQAFFVLVGGPEQRASYYTAEVTRQKINNILFHGPVPHSQVKDYLFAADVLLMIWSTKVRTINYCSPLKMFEYMAAGRIIVGQAFPTIKEVLKDGEHAFLAAPDSFDDLHKKLQMALEQRYPNLMASKARELAMSNYTWETRAKTILACLSERK